MDTKDEEFLKRLQATFRIEANDHIHELTSGLLELEKSLDIEKNRSLLELIFREAHSLKGAARSVNMKDIESVCQVLESIFGALKNKRVTLTSEDFDLIHQAINNISILVSGDEAGSNENYKNIINQLKTILEVGSGINKEQTTFIVNSPVDVMPVAPILHEVHDSNEIISEEKHSQIGTVRISTAKIDPLFLQAEQMIQSKIAATQRSVELNDLIDFIDSWKSELRRFNTRRSIDNMTQLKEVHELNTEKINQIETHIIAVAHAAEADQRLLGRMIDDHLESMKSILMLPVSTITEGFPKIIRDLSRSQAKEVELIILGKETEVDKRILEELKDPLIHLLRNCVDHGVQKSSEREQSNKTSPARITLSFNATESHHLEIVISDNGAGINLENVRKAAIKAGVIDYDSLEKLNPQETLMLIFQSGVSTSKMITDISGRGLGLAIVREKAEKLGGSVSVESHPGKGTTFRFLLPLTLATFRGILVRMADYLVAVPMVNVERVVKVNRELIQTVENRETVMIDGQIRKVVYMSDVLGLSGVKGISSKKKNNDAESLNNIQLLILAHANNQIAFIVDEVLEERQILVKDLGKQLSRVRNISGATVLGSGAIVPVINVSDLMESAIRTEKPVREITDATNEIVEIYKILVVDDSITSRTLIKNILESAGYQVETAVDGVDAYTKTLVGEFDLIVSDVDMPRMNGFELATKIRSDKNNSELPIVLVTALESSEDREHGIDVGANAYIVKSSFDQSNLLEVIKKLI